MFTSLLEVTFMLNLFYSNTILAELPEWSILGKTRMVGFKHSAWNCLSCISLRRKFSHSFTFHLIVSLFLFKDRCHNILYHIFRFLEIQEGSLSKKKSAAHYNSPGYAGLVLLN